MQLTDFLLARIADDEAAANACASVFPPPWDVTDRGWAAYITADAPTFRQVARSEDQEAVPGGWIGDQLAHIARHDPARVLAECEAKRRILADYERYRAERRKAYGGWDAPDHSPIGKALALPYADHPDYDPAWALDG